MSYQTTLILYGNGLRIYHLNVRSLTSKIDELKCIQGVCNQDASVIGLFILFYLFIYLERVTQLVI